MPLIPPISVSSIIPIQPLVAPIADALGISGGATGGNPFGAILSDAIQKVETFQTNASASVDRFLSGEGEELHQVALNTQQADLSFQLFMQVRNKVVSAYQEVMRMQI